MADPLTVIGSAGAICNIVEVLGKTISALNEMRNRWQNSDIILLGLTSQLVSLRAALEKIQAWTDSDELQAHHQLVMDLDVSIACCKLLITKLDDFVTSVNQPTSKPLDITGKAKVVFGISRLDEIQKLLERQTNALVLILTACNCETLSQQKQLLERPRSRKTLQRAEADTASLIVHRDTSSLMSRWTDNLSKISKVFDFDHIVFSTRVYERTLRQSMKETIKGMPILRDSRNNSSIIIYTEDSKIKDRLINDVLGPHISSMERKELMQEEHDTKSTSVILEFKSHRVEVLVTGYYTDPPSRMLESRPLLVFAEYMSRIDEYSPAAETYKLSDTLSGFKHVVNLPHSIGTTIVVLFYQASLSKFYDEEFMEQFRLKSKRFSYKVVEEVEEMFRSAVPDSSRVFVRAIDYKISLDYLLEIGSYANPTETLIKA